MEDPVSLLRQYNIHKKDIVEHDGKITFGEFSWPKNVKTNCRIQIAQKRCLTKEYYTLECLLYFLKNVQLLHPEYVRKAAADNIPAVKRPDRKLLLSYLNGETTTCASIDESVPLSKPNQAKRRHDQDSDDSRSKKSCIENTTVQ